MNNHLKAEDICYAGPVNIGRGDVYHAYGAFYALEDAMLLKGTPKIYQASGSSKEEAKKELITAMIEALHAIE